MLQLESGLPNRHVVGGIHGSSLLGKFNYARGEGCAGKSGRRSEDGALDQEI
jgi:hypothetical protein